MIAIVAITTHLKRAIEGLLFERSLAAPLRSDRRAAWMNGRMRVNWEGNTMEKLAHRHEREQNNSQILKPRGTKGGSVSVLEYTAGRCEARCCVGRDGLSICIQRHQV